jgi:hypothetical protein
MKNVKKLVAVLTVVGMLAAAGAVFAATFKTPAEIAAQVTGKTVEDLNKEREAGKTYGAIANDAGKLADFEAQMLEQKKAILDQRVADGKLTQKQADEIYTAIKDNQANCTTPGSAQMGMKYGVGFGQGSGMGQGCGMGIGQGEARGTGMRNGGGMGAGRGLNR